MSKFPHARYINNSRPCKVDLSYLTKVKDPAGYTPREHQLQLVKALLAAKRGVVKAPTGSGKTLMLALLAGCIRGKVLIVVPTRNLLDQTAEYLSKALKERVGVIGSGQYDCRRVTVGILASIRNMPKDELQTDAIIWDECHHLSADTWLKTALRSQADFRLGMSADPFDSYKVKGDHNLKRMRVVSATGTLVSKVQISEMKDKGIVAKPKIKFYKVPVPATAPEGDFQETYCHEVCANPKLLKSIKTLTERHKGESILIFVKHIHMGKLLERIVKDSKFLWGQIGGSPTAASKIINKSIEDFKNDKLKVIIASSIFDEGTDMPNIDVLILGSSGIAPTQQRLGRGMRRKHGKENSVQVYDFFLEGSEYGEKHSMERLRIYKSEGHSVS